MATYQESQEIIEWKSRLDVIFQRLADAIESLRQTRQLYIDLNTDAAAGGSLPSAEQSFDEWKALHSGGKAGFNADISSIAADIQALTTDAVALRDNHPDVFNGVGG